MEPKPGAGFSLPNGLRLLEGRSLAEGLYFRACLPQPPVSRDARLSGWSKVPSLPSPLGREPALVTGEQVRGGDYYSQEPGCAISG